MARRHDPRVFIKNFGMQAAPAAEDAFDIQSQAAEPLDDGGPNDTGFSNVSPVPPSELSPPQYGQRNHHGDPVEVKNPREGKPFGFALAHGTDGASIWWGQLVANVTTCNVTKADGKITSITQPEIKPPEYYPPSNLETDTKLQTHLGWYGDVYLYWECSSDGAITAVEVVGPDEPDGENIGELDSNLEREITDGKYFVKIGTVDDGSPVDQQISGDVPWFVHIISGTGSDGSEGSTGSEGSETSTGSEDSGSDKSTAIVRLGNIYTALFCMEAPEVLFQDYIKARTRGRKTIVPIDKRFLEVCEKSTVSVASVCPDAPVLIGAKVIGGSVVLTKPWWQKNADVTVQLVGVRKGFLGKRFPRRTREQYEANERFINSAYPGTQEP